MTVSVCVRPTRVRSSTASMKCRLLIQSPRRSDCLLSVRCEGSKEAFHYSTANGWLFVLHYWNAIVIGFDSVSIVSWCKRGWIHEAFLNSVLNRILWISTNIIWLRNLRLAPISKEAVSVNDQLLEAARLMMIIRTLQFCNAALLILLKCSVLLQYYLCRKHINVSSQSQSVKLTASVCITSIHGTALEGRCWLCKLKVDAV